MSLFYKEDEVCSSSIKIDEGNSVLKFNQFEISLDQKTGMVSRMEYEDNNEYVSIDVKQ